MIYEYEGGNVQQTEHSTIIPGEYTQIDTLKIGGFIFDL
jgi:hypothetical protein